MTNEQQAILLRGYYSRLASIFNQLGNDLENIQTLKYHQVGVKSFVRGDDQVKNGNPICLDALDDFQDDLLQDIGDLLNTDYKRMTGKSK